MSWEERMAQRAAERAAARHKDPAHNPHATHHQHLEGTSVLCSCGEFRGVATVAFGPDYNPDDLACDLCGQRGVVRLRD